MKKKFDPEISKQIPITELILLSMHSLGSGREKCDLQRLVKECFSLFPEAFCLSKYHQWPDSRKLDRPLRTLRQRKLIVGNPASSFSLTKTGRQIANEVAKTFRQRKLFK